MKIAITQSVIDFRSVQCDSLEHSFYDMFSQHTLRPIPNNLEHYRTEWIIDSDAIVFTGGNSVFKENSTYNSRRLRIEKHTLDLARLYNIPILAIGEGCQFLTLCLGGKVSVNKSVQSSYNILYGNSRISVEGGTTSNKLIELPLGATPLAHDEFGNCVSWKLDNIVSIMWHPERMKNYWLPYEAHGIVGI